MPDEVPVVSNEGDAPKPKKSGFRRPTWAQNGPGSATSAKTDGRAQDNVGMFSRSEEYFEATMKEQERRKREKAERNKAKARAEEDRCKGQSQAASLAEQDPVAKDTFETKVSCDLEDPSWRKRRRISKEDVEPTLVKKHSPRRKSSSAVTESHDGLHAVVSQPHDEKTIVPSPTMGNRTGLAPVITLDDSEKDEDELTVPPLSSHPIRSREAISRTTTRPPQAHDPASDSESDPELRELARQARAKRRLEKANSHRTDAGPSTTSVDYHSPAFDPTIQLFVTSPIEGTSPLVVSRKLSQDLGQVRAAWCSRNLPPERHNDIIFTYNLRRLYDVTTCKSIGVHVDGSGRVIRHAATTWNDPVPPEHVHKVWIEALTEEILELRKAARTAKRTASSSGMDLEGAAAEETANETRAVEPETEVMLRITLKAKGYKDAKIRVRPTTRFEKVEIAARKTFGQEKPIPDDAQITLDFDGETLDLEQEVQETDLEDKDIITVYIK